MAGLQARGPTVLVLGTICLFGLNSMFGQIYRNGYMEQVVKILAGSDPGTPLLLPGSKNPILTRYLGIPQLDKLLTLATVLWANVTDGSLPQLCLYAFHFGGQLVPVFTVMLIEGLRTGSQNTILRFPVLWGYLMQIFGYAFIMPVYCCLQLFFSEPIGKQKRSAESIRPTSLEPLSREALVPAFALGYFVPTILMAYPIQSNALHQWFGAAWQGFPLYVAGLQHLFASRKRRSSQQTRTAGSIARPKSEDKQTLSAAYDFAFDFAALTQCITIGAILTVKTFPGAFPPAVVDSFTFSNVFVPGWFHSSTPMSSMGTAMHDFFLYDQIIGSAAGIVWAISLYAEVIGSLPSRALMDLSWDMLKWCLLGGPAGVIVRLLQRRDDLVLSEGNKTE